MVRLLGPAPARFPGPAGVLVFVLVLAGFALLLGVRRRGGAGAVQEAVALH